MRHVKKDIHFVFKSSLFLCLLQSGLWLLGLISALIGPFLLIAKLLFCAVWIGLGVIYWRRWKFLQTISQLRFSSGNLILVFNNHQEPQLVYFKGPQRILSWLVELNVLLENNKMVSIPIAFDSLDSQSFRRLKVMVQTRAGELQI
jgi:hypothetical protein